MRMVSQELISHSRGEYSASPLARLAQAKIKFKTYQVSRGNAISRPRKAQADTQQGQDIGCVLIGWLVV